MKRVSALILALMFLFLASCGTDAEPETTTEQANSASTDLKIDYETVKVPFKSVSSPLLLDGKLVMAVATADRTETDRRYLISYDIGSGKYDNIFESTHELGDIQSIRFDGEWLIWNDCEIYNSARNIYCMNYKTKEITQITKLGNDSAVGEPCISDGVVFWDECFDIGGENTRSRIKAYDCTTKETKTISEGGDKVSACDGKAVFTVNKGGKATLGVYDIASGKVTELALGDGSYTLKDCAAGYALYVETKDPSRGGSSQKTWIIDLSNGKTAVADIFPDGAKLFGDYAVSCTASALWFYKRDGGTLSIIDGLRDINVADASFAGNNTVISVIKNVGSGTSEGLVNETEMHIFDLNKLSV